MWPVTANGAVGAGAAGQRNGFRPRAWGGDELGDDVAALVVLGAASFAEVSSYGLGRWAVLPTFLFFAILGNATSGGAVAPPLLPQPFAFLSQWLPTGATVTALRNAVYFRAYQHARPILVVAAWAVALFAAWLAVMRRKALASAPVPSRAAAAPSASLRAGPPDCFAADSAPWRPHRLYPASSISPVAWPTSIRCPSGSRM